MLEFFMSGRTVQLGVIKTTAAPLQVNGRAGFRRAFRELLCVLLESQFIVKSKRHLNINSTIWQVITGSGMGLISSGPISDFAFYCLCEASFLLDPTMRAQHFIKGYVRFKDDLFLVLGGNGASRTDLFHAL